MVPMMLATLLAASAPASSPPLLAFYNAAQEDNLVGATAATFAFAHDNFNGFQGTNTPPHAPNDGLIASNTTAPPGMETPTSYHKCTKRSVS